MSFHTHLYMDVCACVLMLAVSRRETKTKEDTHRQPDTHSVHMDGGHGRHSVVPGNTNLPAINDAEEIQ